MGFLFGSDTTTTQQTTVTTIMPTAGEGSIAAGGSVNILDQEAIEKSLDFARKVYEESGHNFQSALEQTIDYAKYGIDMAKAQTGMVAMAYQTAAQKETPLDYTTMMIVVAVVAGLLLMVQKKRA